MGENVCQSMFIKGLISKIVFNYATQYKKINNPIEKCIEEINRCFQRRNTNDQQVPAKMFTITRHQGSANKNHHEISHHSH